MGSNERWTLKKTCFNPLLTLAIAIRDWYSIASRLHFTRPFHLLVAESMTDLIVSSTFCAHSDLEKGFVLS